MIRSRAVRAAAALFAWLPFFCLPAATSAWQAPTASTSTELPSAWIGDWKGTLRIHSASGKSQEAPMELHIHPIRGGEAYQWQIVYGAGAARQLRDYELIPDRKRAGHFTIDEKDGILLDADLIDGALCSSFQVGTNLLVTRYESRKPGRLRFEVVVYRWSTPSKTAAKDASGEEKVLSYPVAASQIAQLVPVEEMKPKAAVGTLPKGIAVRQ